MNRALQLRAPKSGISRFVLGGVVTGIACAMLNIVYTDLYGQVAGYGLPNPVSSYTIAMASAMAPVMASVFYFVLANCTRHHRLVYALAVAMLTVLSLVGPLSPMLPDGTPTPAGFAMLTLPMHLITGFACLVLVPVFADEQREEA